jgi:hypothetical protein
VDAPVALLAGEGLAGAVGRGTRVVNDHEAEGVDPVALFAATLQ